MLSNIDKLIKNIVCEDCGSIKFNKKLGGVVCSTCYNFYSYERLALDQYDKESASKSVQEA